jgi:diphthine synthase
VLNERFKFESSNVTTIEETPLKELVFVGLGLHDEKGISLNGLEEAKTADNVFIELYTSLLPDFSMKRLEALVGKHVHVVSRCDLEDENGKSLFEAAEKGKAVFLIPGDPFIATTHVTLRIEAAKRQIQTRIVHGASIISAIIGLSGLHNYKFGKTVTVPFPENFSETPYNVIAQNKTLGSHTLCLLDLKADEKRFLTVKQALEMLVVIEQKKKMGIVSGDAVAVGVARAGSNKPTLKADFVNELLNYDFGEPPMSLIFPGQLHFMEAEALIAFARAPTKLRSLAK